jgi:hypothetical protein
VRHSKITHEYNKLNSTEVEDAMMGHDTQKKWFDVVATYGTNQSQGELENFIKGFLLLFMEEDISLDIKEWMSEVKKPSSISVQDFVQRISHLNDLIDYTPIPDLINSPGIQTPSWLKSSEMRVLSDGKRPRYKQIYVISVLPFKRGTILV